MAKFELGDRVVVFTIEGMYVDVGKYVSETRWKWLVLGERGEVTYPKLFFGLHIRKD